MVKILVEGVRMVILLLILWFWDNKYFFYLVMLFYVVVVCLKKFCVFLRDGFNEIEYKVDVNFFFNVLFNIV